MRCATVWLLLLFAPGPRAFVDDHHAGKQQAPSLQATTLQRFIAKWEGWNDAGSRARRDHNPGMLIFAGQPDAQADKDGYAVFPTDEAGWSALERDHESKHRLCMTEEDILATWAKDSRRYLRLWSNEQ